MSVDVPQRAVRRRRAYDGVTFDIAPYRKKPKLCETMVPGKRTTPTNLKHITYCDNIWKISLALNIANLPAQIIGYQIIG